MKLDLFWMIGELKKDKAGMTDLAAVGNIREAELQVIEDVGGIKNKNLSRLYRQTIEQTVNQVDNEISLPDGSGQVIRVSVGDINYTKLSAGEEWAHGKSFMHQHSAVVDGGQIKLLGLPIGSSTAKVVLVRPMQSTIYVEGLRVFQSTRRFSRKGVSNPTFVITETSNQQFDENSLIGGTLRVAISGNQAKDYEIAKNEYIGRDVLYVTLPPIVHPISWLKWARVETPGISEEDMKADPRLDSLQVNPEDKYTYPAAVARTNLPDTLRPLVLTLAKYKATNASQFHAEYTQQVERWKRANES